MASASYPKNKDAQGTLIFMFRDSASGQHHFLSNFWPCKVTLPAEGGLPAMEFDSTEKAYMAWKTLDPGLRRKIQSMSPGDAKKFTHRDDFLTRPDYSDAGRLAIMQELVTQKFSTRNPDLRAKLIATHDATLVEGNTWGDRFFGFDLVAGCGENHLGRILMTVRRSILAEQHAVPNRQGPVI